MSIWRQNTDLMSRLAVAQNHEANINQDITTFVAFFNTREELLRHVESYEQRAANYIAPQKRRRKVA